MLTTKGVEEGAELGADTDTEGDLLICLGTAEVGNRVDTEMGVETLKAEEVLSTFSTEVEADVALEVATEAAFVLTASAWADIVVVEPMSICKARVAFMIAFP